MNNIGSNLIGSGLPLSGAGNLDAVRNKISTGSAIEEVVVPKGDSISIDIPREVPSSVPAEIKMPETPAEIKPDIPVEYKEPARVPVTLSMEDFGSGLANLEGTDLEGFKGPVTHRQLAEALPGYGTMLGAAMEPGAKKGIGMMMPPTTLNVMKSLTEIIARDEAQPGSPFFKIGINTINSAAAGGGIYSVDGEKIA